LGYLHSPWNLEGYCITKAKPRIPSKTLFRSSLKQDVFCRSFFSQFHYCLQPRCKDESFEEKGPTTTMFKEHPNTFHTGGDTLTFWNSFI
jgi:hypothetical protein